MLPGRPFPLGAHPEAGGARAVEHDRYVVVAGTTGISAVIGPDGRHHTAYYPMTQLPDGTWRIDGCYLDAAEEHQA